MTMGWVEFIKALATATPELLPVLTKVVAEVKATLEAGDVKPEWKHVFSAGTASELAVIAERRRAEIELGIKLS